MNFWIGKTFYRKNCSVWENLTFLWEVRQDLKHLTSSYKGKLYNQNILSGMICASTLIFMTYTWHVTFTSLCSVCVCLCWTGGGGPTRRGTWQWWPGAQSAGWAEWVPAAVPAVPSGVPVPWSVVIFYGNFQCFVQYISFHHISMHFFLRIRYWALGCVICAGIWKNWPYTWPVNKTEMSYLNK